MVRFEIPFSKAIKINPPIVFLLKCSNLEKREANIGVNVKETRSDTRVEITTTNANCFIIFPIIPPVKAMGKNTTTSTKVIAKAVKPISFLPSKAACLLFFPISRCLKIFSRTTMESSTRIPITRDMASKVIRLKVKLKAYMKISVVIKEAGMATITISALRKLCRKRSMITATKITASPISSITALTASIVKSEELLAMPKVSSSAL